MWDASMTPAKLNAMARNSSSVIGTGPLCGCRDTLAFARVLDRVLFLQPLRIPSVLRVARPKIDTSTICMVYQSNPMDTWKEFEANELTHSGAHHLLAIFH